MDAKTITKTRLPGLYMPEGPSRRTGGIDGLKGNPAAEGGVGTKNLKLSGPARRFDLDGAALYGEGKGDEAALITDGRFSAATYGFCVAGDEYLEANVTVEELSRRKKDRKPREHGYGAGALWKYAQQAGPVVSGAVTSPGGSHEGVCYADI